MKGENNTHMIGHTLLRVTIGLMFVFAGFKKVMGIDGVVGMLTGIGFPAATLFAWILALSELIFGVLIFIGFKTRYTTWPLAFVLLVAWMTVIIPNQGIGSTSSFFHLIAIAGLITIALTGPGKWALTKR
jgi:putative oxidoreductase